MKNTNNAFNIAKLSSKDIKKLTIAKEWPIREPALFKMLSELTIGEGLAVTLTDEIKYSNVQNTVRNYSKRLNIRTSIHNKKDVAYIILKTKEK